MILALNTRNRKFQDAWALVLFIITLISGLGFLFIFSKTDDYFQLVRHIDPKIALMFFSATFVQFFILLACFLAFPECLMHVAFFFEPVLSLCFGLIFAKEPKDWISPLIFIIVPLIGYFTYFRKQIKFTAIICKKASQKITDSLFLLLSYTVFSTVMFSIFSYFVLQAVVGLYSFVEKIDRLKFYIAFFLITVFYCWVQFNTMYAVRVLFSSIIFCRTISGQSVEIETKKEQEIEKSQNNENKLSNSQINKIAIRNMLASLGSICFGGLLVALTCASKDTNDRSRRVGQSSLFNICCSAFFRILLDLIHYSNKWVFVWVAFTGESFIQSTKHVWQTLFECYGIVDDYITEQVLGMISGLFGLSFAIFAFFIIQKDFDSKFSDDSALSLFSKDGFYYCTGLVFLSSMYLYNMNIIYSMFETGVKALTFTNVLFPEKIRQTDPELAKALLRKKEFLERENSRYLQ